VRRKLGIAIGISGVCLVIYGALVLVWRDPATDVYARWQQRQLAAEFRAAEKHDVFPARGAAPDVAPTPRPVRPRRGRAFARITIPRNGLPTIVVEGTGTADLRKGPGHYEVTPLPGSGGTVAIAGHRTTYGAPFRHIDRLRRGDAITLTLPHGTFGYRVVGHEIVDKADWSIIRRRPHETLVLSACHPLYSAAQRWVVYARLIVPDATQAPSFARARAAV
jgi:sortase A